MTESTMPSDLIYDLDRLNLNLLSKSSPSRVSTFQLNRSRSQLGSYQQDIPSPPLPSKSSVPTNKASNLAHVPCKFFKQGTCTAGANCIFSHNPTPTSEASVCKYFLKGNCKFGTKCALLHTMSPYSEGRKFLLNRNITNDSLSLLQKQQQHHNNNQHSEFLSRSMNSSHWTNESSHSMDGNNLDYSRFFRPSDNTTARHSEFSQLTAAMQQNNDYHPQDLRTPGLYQQHFQQNMPTKSLGFGNLRTSSSPRDTHAAYDQGSSPFQPRSSLSQNFILSSSHNRLNNNNGFNENGNNDNSMTNGTISTSTSQLHSIPETFYAGNDYSGYMHSTRQTSLGMTESDLYSSSNDHLNNSERNRLGSRLFSYSGGSGSSNGHHQTNHFQTRSDRADSLSLFSGQSSLHNSFDHFSLSTSLAQSGNHQHEDIWSGPLRLATSSSSSDLVHPFHSLPQTESSTSTHAINIPGNATLLSGRQRPLDDLDHHTTPEPSFITPSAMDQHEVNTNNNNNTTPPTLSSITTPTPGIRTMTHDDNEPPFYMEDTDILQPHALDNHHPLGPSLIRPTS